MRGILMAVLMAAVCGGAWAQEAARPGAAPATAEDAQMMQGARALTEAEQALPPAQYLALARKPFLAAMWCRFKGVAEYRGEVRRSVPVQLSMRLGTASLQAELTLRDGQVGRVTQTYKADGSLPAVNLDLSPVAPAQMSLEKLGLQADDLTFCFLYWNFVRELPEDSMRGQTCRLLELEHPQSKARVQVWMAKAYAFPLRVCWLRAGEKEPWRSFEFTDFKRNGDFWFPIAMRLSGLVKPKWDARITFKEAEIAMPSEKPEPADLFAAPLLPPLKQPDAAPAVPAAGPACQ
jgi:hypothetical protein